MNREYCKKTNSNIFCYTTKAQRYFKQSFDLFKIAHLY